MSIQKQDQRSKPIKDDQNDRHNLNTAQVSKQSQSQSGPGDHEPPIEISQSRESEDDAQGFIDESLLIERDPNDTDADDEALVLDGLSREVDSEDEEEIEDAEISNEEDRGVIHTN